MSQMSQMSQICLRCLRCPNCLRYLRCLRCHCLCHCQVSRVALCMSKVKVSWQWVSQSVIQWQGHLLSCSGQLKKMLESRSEDVLVLFVKLVKSTVICKTCEIYCYDCWVCWDCWDCIDWRSEKKHLTYSLTDLVTTWKQEMVAHLKKASQELRMLSSPLSLLIVR